ncbi:hypothetical protein D9615_006948 [Tricholomella constricta]|uniref:Glucose-methanol-choline oxidoreductase N-terminal domain-containing protein n=1 Tax=Tricholomella constricta TaxID=117010 RepID=A0A8H5M305_9AGAR|nr:hypothetical protein D9615_006948 [Tricholomella constricta]
MKYVRSPHIKMDSERQVESRCPMLSLTGSWILYICIVAARAALNACPSRADADYDFIVVGSGAGGGPLASRLVESGFSVLLVDAGHEVVNFNTTLPAYNLRSLEDSQIELNYTLQEYPNDFPVQRDDSWYPRARALGGSTIHNAMVNIIAGTRQDFDGLANTFNDQTWSRDNMQGYFKRIEKNLYLLPLLAPDHGFDGWLKTSALPLDVFVRDPLFLDPQLAAIVSSIPLAGLPILDLNSIAEDGSAGVTSPSATVDENHIRSSVHERLQSVQKAIPKGLHLSLDTLAVKLLLCDSPQGVSAYGVQMAPGAALPVASNFAGKQILDVQNVTARHEVIVSAGTFQSPQLLMLSGIGDQDHLQEHGIEPVVHLPGVGNNLQGESPYLCLDGSGSLQRFLSDPGQDPCLRDWLQSNHENLYAFSGVINAVLTQSSPTLPAPDILTYFLPVSFPGFFRGAPQQVADTPNGLTAVILKGHPSSKGTVRLTGSHPQDRLDIQKNHFQAPGGPADVAALREAIKRAREIVTLSPLGLFVDIEVVPGLDATSDEDIDNFVLNRVFGHHACCTNPIGPDNDPDAVLDGNFKVRGVDRLRVVDASSWPNVPGFFITTPTYMISEKAADVVIVAAKARASAESST